VNEDAAKEPTFRKKTLSAGARNVLLGHTWPGNVRELLNTLRRLVIWAEETSISADDAREAVLPSRVGKTDATLGRALGDGFELQKLIEEVARHYLVRAMKEANGNKTKAASLVGLPSYQTLTNWLDRYGVKT
jgi:DNA-binding NtrC family response regulator